MAINGEDEDTPPKPDTKWRQGWVRNWAKQRLEQTAQKRAQDIEKVMTAGKPQKSKKKRRKGRKPNERLG